MNYRRFSVALITGLILSVLSCSNKGGITEHMLLEILPSSVSFGAVDIYVEHKRDVKLTHAGTSGIIRLEGLSFTDATSDEFWVDPLDVDTLEPGESTTITIHYKPTDSEADSGDLVIDHNVPPDSRDLVHVSSLAPVAELIAIPNPIDFGEVPVGEFRDLDVTIGNYGTDVYTVNQISLRLDGSDDFTLISDPVTPSGDPLPVDLTPDATIGLVMRYEPTGGGTDESWLIADGLSKGQKVAFSFLVRGQELGPHIVVSPGAVDFGEVDKHVTATRSLTIANDGNHPLEVVQLDVQKLDPEFDVRFVDEDGEDLPNPLTGLDPLESGASTTFSLAWTADKNTGQGNQIASILIPHSDAAQGLVNVDVFGVVKAPHLLLVPDFVDFGFVGQMITADRTLTLVNEGVGDLIVNPGGGCIEITGDDLDGFPDEFDFVKMEVEEFGPASGQSSSCPEGTIPGSSSQPITLTFTNRGPDTGTADATMIIRTNEEGQETVEIPLRAKRAGTPTCEPVLLPPQLNFGIVPKGQFKEMTFKLLNNGTGYCGFSSARIEDCSGLFGLSVTCEDPGTGPASSIYQFMGLPPAVQNGMGPGAQEFLKVRFTPPDNDAVFAMLATYPALASMTLFDSQLQKEVVVPACGGGNCKNNLDGDSGVSKISVLPGEVDFGLVTIGCFSQTFKVCVYSSGNAPLEVSNISLSNCTPEFKLKEVPPLPKSMSAGVQLCFQTVYAPQDEGTDTCHVHIDNSDAMAPLVAVKLSGEGTFETHQVDLFTQVSGQEVDVLFVIDDSGSMCEEQDMLVDGYEHFIQQAEVWGNEYHLGVISMNVVDDLIMGKLNLGDPSKGPRYLTPEQGTKEDFKKLADIGCEGGPHCEGLSGGPCTGQQEAGLQAAQMALTAPLSSNTGVACGSDADCLNDPQVCSDPDACPYGCVDGFCGGWNHGFLRDDAQLELVFLSDEEDQSPASLYEYIDFFKEIKGFYNMNMMHAHAIVAQPPLGCDDTGAGWRYIDLAEATGGTVGDICGFGYDQYMSDIGSVSFSLKVQFFLSRLADPASVLVWVNGEPCPSGWTYDAPSNAVVFDEDGPCMPQPGDGIKIEYDTLCLTE